jgi:hypothetical protein
MIRTRARRHFSMHFHLLSLSTNQSHPKAAVNPIEWPTALAKKEVSLSFQICDDGLYILSQRNQLEGTDRLCGWQWTTGRHAVVSQSSIRASMVLIIDPSTSWNDVFRELPTSHTLVFGRTRHRHPSRHFVKHAGRSGRYIRSLLDASFTPLCFPTPFFHYCHTW